MGGYVAEADVSTIIGYVSFFAGLILAGLGISLVMWWKRHKATSREWIERNKDWWMG